MPTLLLVRKGENSMSTYNAHRNRCLNLCIEKGIETVAELSKRADISLDDAASIINQREVSDEVYEKVASALEVTIQYLKAEE